MILVDHGDMGGIRRLLIIVAMLWGNVAFADPIMVRTLGDHDVAKLDLPTGKTAIVRVFLQSFGSEIGGYDVAIYRDKDKVQLATVTSDDNGEVGFTGVPAGEYTLLVEIGSRRRNIREGIVKIGDVRLSIEK